MAWKSKISTDSGVSHLPVVPVLDTSEGEVAMRIALARYRGAPDNIGYNHIRRDGDENALFGLPRGDELKFSSFREMEEYLDMQDNHNVKIDPARLVLDTRAGSKDMLDMRDQLELSYTRAICHAAAGGEVGKQCAKQLHPIRKVLAHVYAGCAISGMSPQQKEGKTPEALLEAKTADYLGLLEGTLSAYLLNVLKEQKLVPEATKFSMILRDRPGENTGMPGRE